MGLVDCLGDGIYLRTIISELLFDDGKKKVIPVIGIVDNMQLYEHVYSTKLAADKRLRIDIADLQEMIEKGEVSELKWVPTDKMISDTLTKKNSCSYSLNQVLETGLLEI